MTAAGKCPLCNWLSVRPRTGRGRTMAYRVFADLALPDDVPIPTCGGCGATYTKLDYPATAKPAVPSDSDCPNGVNYKTGHCR